MATQVTYKGSTIANFTNTTKTLKTAGKYMEGDVAVTESISLQNKSVNPTESSQTITKDSGYEGLGTVTVGAISNTYVGTSVPKRTAADLTASGSTVTTPSGYYSSAVAKNVAAGTATTPAVYLDVNPSVTISNTTGLITVSGDVTSSVTPTIVSGYISQGVAGTFEAVAGKTLQLTSQAAATITPTESVKTAVASYRWTTGEVKVAAISSTYVGTGVTRQGATTITPTETQQTAVNASVYTTGAITVKAISSTYVGSGIPLQSASTYNVSTEDRLIASGTYLTGSQTIKSVTTTNIEAANIVSGVTIKVGDANNASRITQVTGTYSGIIPTGVISITAAGNTNVTAYATASVRTGYAANSATTITTNPTITIASATGVVTGTYTGSSNITPAITSGWISTATAGKVTTTGTSTLNLTTQSAVTITPTESTQTAVDAYRWTTGSVTVGAISNKYVGSAVPTQAASTYNTSTADRTIAAGTYLTGAQTIKSVTTANISPENIKSGVTVTVGDANSAGRIKNITGTYETTYTATVYGTGNATYCYVSYNGTKYSTGGNDGTSFQFKPTDTLTIYCRGNSVTINKDSVTLTSYGYSYTLPPGDIEINLSYSTSTSNSIEILTMVKPAGNLNITAAGTHNVYKYSTASVAAGGVNTPTATSSTTGNQVTVTPAVTYTAGYIAAGNKTGTGVTVSASQLVSGTATLTGAASNHNVVNYSYASVKAGAVNTPATTITKNPGVTISNTTGLVTATYTGTSDVKPNVGTSGWISAGNATSGTITTSGTGTLQLAVKAAATITPSETAQTIASNQWLTGTQTIAAISNTYVGTSVTRQSASTYDVSTADRTIAAGTYLTGAQTIKGVTGKYTVTSGGTFDVKTYSQVGVAELTLPSTTLSQAPTGYTQRADFGRSTADRYVAIGTGFNSNFYYYKIDAVADGTAGTPTATKGTVSSNKITITPTVTNTTGYITGGTITGNAVTVNASELVAGNINLTKSTSTDVTNYATATVAAGAVKTPATTISIEDGPDFDLSIDNATGKVTVTGQLSQNVTPSVTTAGWITSDNASAGKFTATVDGTLQLATKSAATITPTESSQTIASNQWLTGVQTIAAISNTYVGTGVAKKSSADTTFASATGTFTAPAGYYSAAATKTITVEGGGNIFPSTADQTIASYRWLSGPKTIKSVVTSNLAAANIVSGVTVKVGDATNASRITQITGTYSGIIPTGTVTLTGANSQHNVAAYQYASVKAGTATTPATTISYGTDDWEYGMTSSTGNIWVEAASVKYITPTIVSGWVSSGVSGKVTASLDVDFTLTTQAAQTINTSTADQTIASYRWLTGTQTIKSVTTANITAANIKSGVTVTVGDANSAGRIKNVTGTLVEAPTYTCTINADSGSATSCYVQHKGVKYYTNTSFTFRAGDEIIFYAANNSGGTAGIWFGGGIYADGSGGTAATYTMTALGCNMTVGVWGGTSYAPGIEIYFDSEYVELEQGVALTPSEDAATYYPSSSKYGFAYIVLDRISSTYVGTGIARKSSADVTFTSTNGTFTAPIGYYSAAATKTLTTQAAQTIYTSTADQTVASYRWLTGTQTIKSVTTSNLTAANIVKDVVVKVGDANNASRITQVTGTYAGIIPTGTVTLTGANSQHNVSAYQYASVQSGAVTVPATTIDLEDVTDITISSTTGKITVDGTASVYVTPNVTSSGWVSSGNVTSGKIIADVFGSLQLTTQAAQTIYTSTADKTISSYRWLTGTQTIKSVTTTNITAANIASGVTVKVGDANNASRILQVTGTYTGGAISLSTGSSLWSSTFATGTTVLTLGSFTLPKGQWQVDATVRWNSNSSGRRYMLVSTASTATTAIYEDTAAPVNGSVTHCRTNFAVNNTAANTWYVRGFQNGGASLAAYVRIYYIGTPG